MTHFSGRAWLRKVFGGRSIRRREPSRGNRPQIELLEDRLAPAVITVNTADDELKNNQFTSLREAILESNRSVGVHDTIRFNIGKGVRTIQLNSELPTITDPVNIDGTSQPGANAKDASTVRIILDGSKAKGADGLKISAGASNVQGLGILAFDGAGIHLLTRGGNTVVDSYIGYDPTDNSRGNGDGVFIDNSPNNTIGGATSGRNVISANYGNGVRIRGAQATNNLVAGNFIGTDKDGGGPLGKPNFWGNSKDGVAIVDASQNDVSGNVISGNLGNGVHILGGKAAGNVIQKNVIGMSVRKGADGQFELGTGLRNGANGVLIEAGASNNLVGGTSGAGAAETKNGNIIAGNIHDGVAILGKVPGGADSVAIKSRATGSAWGRRAICGTATSTASPWCRLQTRLSGVSRPPRAMSLPATVRRASLSRATRLPGK